MAYPTTAALVAASSIDALVDATDPQQDAYRNGAISAIEDFCHQRFVPVAKTVVIDGPGGGVLYLPERLAAVTAVSVNSYALPGSAYTLGSDFDRLVIANLSGVSWVERAEWEAEQGSQQPTFRQGNGNVSITGTWGWPDVDFPAAVGEAIRIDMEDQALADRNELGASVRAFRALGIRNVNQGGLNLSLGATRNISPQVARLLRRYVWQDVLGAAA